MRGYQKKIIFLKNVNCEVFEEAYFVIRCEEKMRKNSHATMVAEAKRIIEESFGPQKRRFKFLKIKTLLAFLSGVVLSFCLTLAFLK